MRRGQACAYSLQELRFEGTKHEKRNRHVRRKRVSQKSKQGAKTVGEENKRTATF